MIVSIFIVKKYKKLFTYVAALPYPCHDPDKYWPFFIVVDGTGQVLPIIAKFIKTEICNLN